MINGIVRSFQNVLNQDSGGQVRCILLYFEEKQNTNYFDQSEAVKAPINLLMYRSFRNSSATKIHCFHIKCLYLPKYTAHTLLHIFAVVFMFCHICDMTFNCDDIWGAGDSADYCHWRFCLLRQILFFKTEYRLHVPLFLDDFSTTICHLLYRIGENCISSLIGGLLFPPQKRRCWRLIYCLLFVMFQHFTRAWLMN